ncbi:MAG: cytochrome c [Gammaproteobacteria bacterium]|nr:MAG: cytochrome c [Gammaproteobacteria bacterium]
MITIRKKTLGSLLFISVISISNISCANDSDATNKAAEAAVGTKLETTTDAMSHGEEAHKNHCYKCHTDEIYTRDNRFVKSIDALSKQVVRCKEGSDIPWFDEDSEAVVQFLNKKYYKF